MIYDGDYDTFLSHDMEFERAQVPGCDKARPQSFYAKQETDKITNRTRLTFNSVLHQRTLVLF